MQRKKVIITEPDKIIEYLEGKSDSIVKMIQNNIACNYVLFQKYLSHSDLIAAGKRLGKDQSVEKKLFVLLNKRSNA